MDTPRVSDTTPSAVTDATRPVYGTCEMKCLLEDANGKTYSHFYECEQFQCLCCGMLATVRA